MVVNSVYQNPLDPEILSDNRAQLPCCLKRRSVVVRLLGSRVRILLGIWMFVFCVLCCVSSGPCDKMITRSEETYRLNNEAA